MEGLTNEEAACRPRLNHDLRPFSERVSVIRSRQLQWIDARDVVVDDIVELGRGDRVPGDAVVVRLQSNMLISTVHLTGETEPRRVELGDELPSSCTVREGGAWARITAVGLDSSFPNVLFAPDAKFKQDLDRDIAGMRRLASTLVSLGWGTRLLFPLMAMREANAVFIDAALVLQRRFSAVLPMGTFEMDAVHDALGAVFRRTDLADAHLELTGRPPPLSIEGDPVGAVPTAWVGETRFAAAPAAVLERDCGIPQDYTAFALRGMGQTEGEELFGVAALIGSHWQLVAHVMVQSVAHPDLATVHEALSALDLELYVLMRETKSVPARAIVQVLGEPVPVTQVLGKAKRKDPLGAKALLYADNGAVATLLQLLPNSLVLTRTADIAVAACGRAVLGVPRVAYSVLLSDPTADGFVIPEELAAIREGLLASTPGRHAWTDTASKTPAAPWWG